MESRPAIPALTGLRFVAALTVVISHSVTFLLPFPGGAMPRWQLYLHAIGGIGMPLFFVLSGFVIHYNYSTPISQDGAPGIVNFFVARFARLYPLFIVCLAFDLVFKYCYEQLPASTGQALPYYLSLTQSWVFAPSADGLLIFRFGPMPQVSWSISTEWFFYLLYPAICPLLSRLATPLAIRWAIAALFLAAALVIGALGLMAADINSAAREYFGPIAVENLGFFVWLMYFSPYLRIFEFLLGCLCAALYMRVAGKPVRAAHQRLASFAMITATILALLLVWFFYVPPQNLVGVRIDPDSLPALARVVMAFASCFGFAPLIGIVIFCAARYRNPIVAALSSPLLVLCGEASYSLYLLHLTVIYAFRFTVSPIVSPAVGIANAMMWGFTLLCTIGLSLVTWRLIEVPARRWLRRTLLLRKSAPAPQAAE